jgi:NADH:ubiquinone oxidoreductase subunit 5 (subunit L)/multisubunit Na+/H+ antiporter MnhA subunit
VLAEVAFTAPHVDFAALAPEIVLTAGAVLVILLDALALDKVKPYISLLSGATLLGAMIPILWLADNGVDRSMFGGAFVVDNFALVLKAMFLLSGYVVVLLATNYIAEGDYWENEFYALILSSLLGMVVMCSARDLLTIFVALELLSIPAYMLATWRKRDLKSNEAGLKYYLMGVFASAIMLYGMSLVFGAAGSTNRATSRRASRATTCVPPWCSGSCSWSSGSRSRCRPSPSTRGRPTRTKVRPRRSPPSWPWPPRPPGSWPSCSSCTWASAPARTCTSPSCGSWPQVR